MSSSAITKKALADSLKNLCTQKPFDKISISDITNDCGLNRQSFYYHFQDKFELLSWVYYNELFKHYSNGIGFSNWSERLEELLRTMEQNRSFYTSTLKSGDNTFQKYLFSIVHQLFIKFFEYMVTPDAGIYSTPSFFADFYAHGFCGIIIDWAVNGMNVSPHNLMIKFKNLAFENGYISEGFKQTF